ncbi:MAG TPA: hypothetical protein PKA37_13610, partial [Planctomycetota bacterium]|nr:hypothetical protein [Planctomycetota bacterium]
RRTPWKESLVNGSQVGRTGPMFFIGYRTRPVKSSRRRRDSGIAPRPTAAESTSFRKIPPHW